MTEPFPGWIDNVHTGGFAFIAGTAKGAFRVSCADHRCLADLVPNTPSLEVYHLSSASSNPITWGEYTDAVVKLVREFPCSEVLWYPASKCRLSPLRMYSSVFLLQVFPACVLNLLAKIQGTSDQGLLSIQLKFWRGMMHVKYFTKRQWIFDGSNTAHLAAMLSPKDKLDFNFNVKRINWTSFLTTNILGLREHFHKEPLDTLVSARHKMKT
ncbi:hypothetical protein C0J52_18195 [Blattella germanica]|nr:hypothetical protein C0J52_18195 [Blattella germanica]